MKTSCAMTLAADCSTVKSRTRQSKTALAVLPIQQIAHCFPALFVRFLGRLALVAVHAALGGWGFCFGGAALRTVVGKAGLVRLELKLFRADSTGSDRKSHTKYHTTLAKERGS